MKRLLLVLCLSGCAQHPQEPTQGQLALLAYYVEVCKKQGVDPDNIDAMRGCILVNNRRDLATTSQRGLGDVLQGLGSVYSGAGQQQPSQQRCTTKPDYAGGWITSCY